LTSLVLGGLSVYDGPLDGGHTMGRVGYTVLVLLVLAKGHAVGQTPQAPDPNGVALPAQPVRPSITDLLPSVLSAVVKIDTDSGFGTGFIVSPDGYLITAAHVISQAKKARVELKSGEKYDAVSVIELDARRDIAVLKIKGFKLPSLTLADSDSVQIGTRLILVGNPVPRGIQLDWTVTDGLLSARRPVDGYTLFQTSVASAPGASGGPVLNEDAKVVAVHVMGIPGEGFKFAVPSNYVAAILQDIKRVATAPTGGQTLGVLVERSLLGISGEWSVLNTNRTVTVREDEEHIYVSGLLIYPNGMAGSTSYELTKQSNGSYSGKILGRWVCEYETLTGASYQQTCPLSKDVVVTKISPTRIEGRVLAQATPESISGYKKFCKSCGNSVMAEWYSFTWVRGE
jgi:S1-C subfamily serine protease